MAKKLATPSWGRFVDAHDDERYNIVWASQGVGGTGKSHFLLTAPEPIAVMLFDPAGLKGLIQNPLFKKKDVRVIDYTSEVNLAKYTTDEDRAKAATDGLAQFEDDWQVALKHARTIGWDKEDYVWEMLRYAMLEAVSGRPASYYELNMKYRAWFSQAESAGVNFGVLRGMKERWGTKINRKSGAEQPFATGEMDPRGMKEVPELVQVNLSHYWDEEARAFTVKILEKCRLGNAVDLINTEHKNLTFEDLAIQLYPDTDVDVWA